MDGDFRDHAALMAIPKVKSNGLLIVDNANWFLPSETKSPSSVRQNEKCKTVTWEAVSYTHLTLPTSDLV